MRIGIDLGGTKIEGLRLDGKGQELDRLRRATPQGNYEATLELIASMVTALDPSGDAPVGVGVPGALSPATGRIKNANSTCLIGQPLDQDLKKVLKRPVRIANDANCFAISEATDGAAAGKSAVFGIILGTGVGAGIVIDGKILTGPHAIAGEWGHNPLPWPSTDELPGRPCYCGKSGCLETWLSGPGIAADHQTDTERLMTAERIAERASQGDSACKITLDRFLDRLARGIAGVINILDPDVIVLGGGVSHIQEIYQQIPTRLGPYVFSDVVNTPVVQNRHGDASGVRGAAWLWPKES